MRKKVQVLRWCFPCFQFSGQHPVLFGTVTVVSRFGPSSSCLWDSLPRPDCLHLCLVITVLSRVRGSAARPRECWAWLWPVLCVFRACHWPQRLARVFIVTGLTRCVPYRYTVCVCEILSCSPCHAFESSSSCFHLLSPIGLQNKEKTIRRTGRKGVGWSLRLLTQHVLETCGTMCALWENNAVLIQRI